MIPIPPIAWKIAGAAVLVVGAVAAWNWYIGSVRREADAAGYARRADEDRKAMEAQSRANLELQRAAERKYTATTEVRDRFITNTITEYRHESAPLADCRVPEPVRVRLNAAAGCARGDSAAACGPGEPVRDAR